MIVKNNFAIFACENFKTMQNEINTKWTLKYAYTSNISNKDYLLSQSQTGAMVVSCLRCLKERENNQIN